MDRIWSNELSDHIGETVRLAGWLHMVRRLSHVTFLILRDGRGLVQVVLEDERLKETIGRLSHESVLEVEARVVAEPQAPEGAELHDPIIRIVSEVTENTPVDLSRRILKAQLPTLLDHAAVTLRHPRRRACFFLAAATLSGFRSTLASMGFIEVQTPKIVASATEGGANVFALDYFGRRAYLAQSPQFYKQTLVGVFERVFEVGPVFRAEPHDTPRHINEYVSLDIEMGFITDHTTVMFVLHKVLEGMLNAIQSEAEAALKVLGIQLPIVPRTIPVVDFADAQNLLVDSFGKEVLGESDLSPAHEIWLGEWARNMNDSDFLFVTGFPLIKRPFYTHPDPQRPQYSNSFDLLFRGLELVTGGQRLHRYQDYRTALAARGLDVTPFEQYLEAFRYGMPPHGGFAIGLERWVAKLTGSSNIRETTLFPRDLTRVSP